MFKRIGFIWLCLLATPTAHAGEEIKLPMGDVYDQRATFWCWAYSSFHTLRTFYLNQPDAPQDWAEFLHDLDSPTALREFLADRVPRSEKHYPYYFLELLQQEAGVEIDGWTGYFRNPRCPVNVAPGGNVGDDIEREDVAEVIERALRAGAPVVFCGNGHCKTIFGAQFENGRTVRYWVADSLTGIDLRSSAAMMETFCSIMTLVL